MVAAVVVVLVFFNNAFKDSSRRNININIHFWQLAVVVACHRNGAKSELWAFRKMQNHTLRDSWSSLYCSTVLVGTINTSYEYYSLVLFTVTAIRYRAAAFINADYFVGLLSMAGGGRPGRDSSY